jgi:hypothetical protein
MITSTPHDTTVKLRHQHILAKEYLTGSGEMLRITGAANGPLVKIASSNAASPHQCLRWASAPGWLHDRGSG